jgi:hypothetical protein
VVGGGRARGRCGRRFRRASSATSWPSAPGTGRSLRLLRKVVSDALPGVGEEVQGGKPCYLVGREKVACLYVVGDRVNLGFFQGAELDDPTGLLAGSGEGMRHVEVAVPSDIKRRELGNLLGQAAWHDRRGRQRGREMSGEARYVKPGWLLGRI